MWLCDCECGGEIIEIGSRLRMKEKQGTPIDCGCTTNRTNEVIDETGNKYGRLSVIEYVNEPKTGWLCQCDCGEKIIVGGANLRSGNVTGCGCYHPLPKGEAAFNYLIARWKHRAKKKNFKYNLTREQVRLLIKQPCFYCGIEPYHVASYRGNGTITYQGLDRVDNDKGYTFDNVVPCCRVCNHAKATMSMDEFKELIWRIHNNWLSGDC